MSQKSISFIVCTNGFGHFKRVSSVVVNLIKNHPQIQVNIFCSQQHTDSIANWTDTLFISTQNTVRFYTEPMAQAPRWLDASYTFDEYTTWRNGLAGNEVLKQSTLIISDNYTAPLHLFPNVMLMGSFLWHDILEIDADKAEIVSFEKNLLHTAARPEMICLAEMAMPEILNHTTAVKVPWFCEREIIPEINRPFTKNILITGGGTEAADDELLELCLLLGKEKNYNLYTDTKLFTKTTRLGIAVKKFEFTGAAFLDLDLIICRPGIGILTDAVKYCTPVICVAESDNKEMVFNANKIETINAGRNYIGISAGDRVEGIKEIYSDNSLQIFRENITKQQTGGAAIAAAHIYSRV